MCDILTPYSSQFQVFVWRDTRVGSDASLCSELCVEWNGHERVPGMIAHVFFFSSILRTRMHLSNTNAECPMPFASDRSEHKNDDDNATRCCNKLWHGMMGINRRPPSPHTMHSRYKFNSKILLQSLPAACGLR